MDAEIIKFIIGGGLTVLVGAVGKFIYDLIQGRVIKEDSAVAQWKGIAESRLQEIHELRRELGWYRGVYPRLWHAYERLEPPDKEKFPTVPPPPDPIPDSPSQ